MSSVSGSVNARESTRTEGPPGVNGEQGLCWMNNLHEGSASVAGFPPRAKNYKVGACGGFSTVMQRVE